MQFAKDGLGRRLAIAEDRMRLGKAKGGDRLLLCARLSLSLRSGKSGQSATVRKTTGFLHYQPGRIRRADIYCLPKVGHPPCGNPTRNPASLVPAFRVVLKTKKPCQY